MMEWKTQNTKYRIGSSSSGVSNVTLAVPKTESPSVECLEGPVSLSSRICRRGTSTSESVDEDVELGDIMTWKDKRNIIFMSFQDEICLFSLSVQAICPSFIWFLLIRNSLKNKRIYLGFRDGHFPSWLRRIIFRIVIRIVRRVAHFLLRILHICWAKKFVNVVAT